MDEGDRLIEEAKASDCRDIAARLLDSARKSNKFACPVCPSSDALHVYEDGAYCYSGQHSGAKQMDAIDLVKHALGVGFRGAVEHLTGRSLDDVESSGGKRQSRETRTETDTHDPEYDQRAAVFEIRDGLERGEAQVQARQRGATASMSAGLRTQARRKVKEIEEAAPWTGGADLGPTTSLLERLTDAIGLGERGTQYLASRGIPEDVARGCGVVSCTRDQWGAWCGELGDDDSLRRSGLIARADTDSPSLHPFYSHFLVFPYYTEGCDAAMSTLRFRDTSGDVTPKMLSVCGDGPTTSSVPYLQWCVQWARDDGLPLFVVEGELDALSIVACGYPAVATYSASVWPPEWCAGWGGLTCAIVVAEGDPAGDAFAGRVSDAAVQVNARWARANVHKVKIREGDCNDLLMQGDLKSQLDSVSRQIG